MTATTLSSLKNVPVVVKGVPDRRDWFAAGVVELGDCQPHRVVRLCPPASPVSDHRPPRRPSADALEHKARGLLNLVALLTRCAEVDGATDEDRREWRRQIDEANEVLEALYRAGLSRGFMTDRPAAR